MIGRWRDRHSRATHLAGWVFADLILVILLLVLVMTPARPSPPGPSTSASPSITPSPGRPSITPTLPAQSHKPVLELEDVPKIRIPVNGADLVAGGARAERAGRDLRSKLANQLAVQGLTDRQAGLVLTFGAAPTPEFQGNLGKRVAQRANQAIKSGMEDFRTIKSREYWTDGAAGAFVEIEIFFFSE